MPVSEQDIIGFLQEQPTTAGVQSRNLPPGIASPQSAGRDIDASLLKQQFIERHQRPGVEFDTDTGAPLLTRFKIAFAPDDNTRVEQLKQLFAGAQIEPIDAGNVIIRNLLDPETGRPVDLLVDELGLSMKDMTELASALPEVAGAILGMIGATKGRGKLPQFMQNKLGQMASLAVGGETGAALAGGAADATARALANQDVRLAEIAGRRAAGAAMGVGFELLTGGTGMLLNRARSISPITGLQQTLTDRIVAGSQPGAEVTEGLAAAARLEATTGIHVPMTLGQRTGNETVLATEAISAKTPFGKRRFKRILESGDQAMLGIQNWLLGRGPLPDSQNVGQQAVEAMRRVVNSDQAVVEVLGDEVLQNAAGAVQRTVNDATGFGTREVGQRLAGRVVKGNVIAQRQAFREKATELTTAINQIPEALEPFVMSKPMKDELEPLFNRLSELKTVEEPSSLLDEFGDPLPATTKEGKRVMFDYVPAPVKKFLNDAVNFPENVTLERIRDFRDFLHESISESEILMGQPSKFLKDISHAVRTAIEVSADAAKTPELKEKLLEFNKFYATNIERFQVKGITEILAEPTQRKLGTFAIARQAMDDPDQYFRLKDTLTQRMKMPDGTAFGPDTTQSWNVFKQSMITEVSRRAGAGVGQMVDSAALLREFKALKPEILQDLLGGDGSRAVLYGLEKASAVQGKVPIKEAIETLQKKGADVSDLRKLATAQSDLAKTYGNSVVKKFVQGETSVSTIDPDEFVERFTDNASRADIAEAIAMIRASDPDTADAIARKEIQKVFHDAARNPSAVDIARGLREDATVMVDPKKVLATLRDETKAGKLRTIIGNDAFALLQDYGRLENMRQSGADAAARSVGGLIGGSMLNDIITLQFKQIPAHAKYWFLARVLTSPDLRVPIQQAAKAQMDPATVVKALVVSAPFIKAVYDDYDPEAAKFLMEQFGVESGLVPRDGRPAAPTPQDQRIERFLQE